ncbi:MAG: MFS transporter [SAR324 cluster bacterium]|nr:MFS transporter [SAR324 cluster bacterium]
MFTSSRLTVGFSNLGHTYTHLFTLLYPTVVLALEREFNRPYGELLTLALPGFILFGAGAVPAGWLSDRWSSKGMLAVFFFGLGGSAILTGLADSPWQIGAGLALLGLFASIYHPVGIAMLVSHATNRGRTLGFNGVFGSLGTAFAALVAGALTDWISWRAAFIVPGILAAATGVAFLLMARGVRISTAAPKADNRDVEHSRAVMIRAMIVLIITLICTGLIYQVTSIAMPKIVADRVSDISVSGALGVGGLVTVIYLSSGLAQVAGGYLADRYPLKLVYLLAYLWQAPLYFVAAVLGGPALLVASAALISLNVAASPAETILITHYSPAKWRATALGGKFAVALGVSALGVPAVALIYDHTGGFFWLFAGMGILAGVAALAILFLPGRLRDRTGLVKPSAASPLAAPSAGG